MRLRRNFVEKIQSSRHIVISYLVRQMDLDIVEATTVMVIWKRVAWFKSNQVVNWRKRVCRYLMKWITVNQYQKSERFYKLIKILLEDEQHKDMKLKVKVAYALLKTRLELLGEDSPYFTNCLQDFFGNTVSPASPLSSF